MKKLHCIADGCRSGALPYGWLQQERGEGDHPQRRSHDHRGRTAQRGSSDSSTPGTTPDGNTASSGDLDPDLPATNSDLETDPSLPASNGDLNPDSDTDSTEEP